MITGFSKCDSVFEDLTTKEMFDMYEAEKLFVERLSSSKRNKIIEEYSYHGSNDYLALNSFKKQIKEVFIAMPDHPYFEELYNLTKNTFGFSDKRSSKSFFNELLSLNNSEELTSTYGPFKEAWIGLKHPDPNTDKLLGCINFSVYKPKSLANVVTVQNIYISVDPEYRKLGLGKMLLDLAEQRSKQLFKGSFYFFAEITDPLKITLKQYLLENSCGLLDQCDKRTWWNNREYGFVDINYEPPFSDNENHLTLNVKSSKYYVDSRVLKAHLDTFFNLSYHLGERVCNTKFNEKYYEKLFLDYSKLRKKIEVLFNNETFFDDVLIGDLLKFGSLSI